MSDEEDYLSDKFLAINPPEAASRKTYSQLRKETLKKSQEKNERHRIKGKRQREVEAREEGLSKSLFEKAQEEQQVGSSSGNKALSMMMKMGFQPGQTLGKQSDTKISDAVEPPRTTSPSPPRHRTEPLPLNEWLGKKGIGTVKRARSPGAVERMAKMAKMEEDSGRQLSFRDRARQEYQERQAEGKLGPAQRTCATLDEKNGKTLNVLWLNPHKPETFPSGLMEALTLHNHDQYELSITGNSGENIQERLRRQMQADALTTTVQEPDSSEEEGENDADFDTKKEKKKMVELNQHYEPEFLEEAVQFLRLQPQDRLHLVVSYLRTTYAYCFYCGTEYESQEEMAEQCPGPEEEDHD